jgi:hypothetical protein
VEVPGVIGDELNDFALFISLGRVTLEVAGHHVLVVGSAVAREAGGDSGKAVFQSVHRGGLTACLRFGPGGVLGVLFVCVQLSFRDLTVCGSVRGGNGVHGIFVRNVHLRNIS